MEASEDEIAFLTVSSTLFEKRKAEALQEKRADFIDYINAIKYIRRSRWVDEAAKAHEIRKKRNLVHAKLCLEYDDINEDVCREVISYLSDVLKTRGINSNRYNKSG